MQQPIGDLFQLAGIGDWQALQCADAVLLLDRRKVLQ
jgi:hypothetical protein